MSGLAEDPLCESDKYPAGRRQNESREWGAGFTPEEALRWGRCENAVPTEKRDVVPDASLNAPP